MVLTIHCSGSPYEIGHTHGSQAAGLVKGSLAFYRHFFHKSAHLEWDRVIAVAQQFAGHLESQHARYIEEMQGVADGAGVTFPDILALNVRTEIAYGMQADGCTAFAIHRKDVNGTTAFLAQNWDWNENQIPRIVRLRIAQEGKPGIEMMTEAGIIGKIGLNSAGVGVTLNAIAAKGVNFQKIPVHLALRRALECGSAQEAQDALSNEGIAAACHITIADQQRSIGLECTYKDVVLIEAVHGVNTHSNHLIRPHGVKDNMMLGDSKFRLGRVQDLLRDPNIEDSMTSEKLRVILRDEENYPYAICRAASQESNIATLFSIVMDLSRRNAWVKIGRPTANGEELTLSPDRELNGSNGA